MPLDLITYGDKTNLNAVTEILKQVAAEDMNEIKAVVNAAVNEINGAAVSERYVYTVNLPSSGSVAGRIAGATVPSGWSLSVGASPLDLVITHDLGRRVASVTVFANISGTEYQQMLGTAAWSAIYTPDDNSCRIASLATILKPLDVYLVLD